jgi:arylsulfatase A-like enzyme
MGLHEYREGTAFPGVIGRTVEVSTPAWPAPVRAREGAPNVVLIVLDDTGFGQLGCYGSPIRTPHIDALAAEGLRFNNMHTTALCSPSRACLLTGRNHHSNNLACITEGAMGYPGANGSIPFANGFLSEILLQNGYNTYAVGKWHLTPSEQTSAAGPYDRWPLGRGFERFYGFLGAETHQYYPELVRDNSQIAPPRSPEEGYHLTPDLVEKARAMIADSKQVAPQKPFFLYFCTGAMHAPHHVPKEWADRYKGQFDAGWDAYRETVFARQKELGIVPAETVLSRHDPDVPDWESLSAEERRLCARMMEVFAGFLEHTDHHIGELMAFLKEIGEYDNTLIMVISDNGASAEGGPGGSVNEGKFFNNVADDLAQNLAAIDEIASPRYFNHYPWGWAHAGNTPFRRWKRETYRGGTSDPFLICWPNGIAARGEIRQQYGHAIDLLPTVLDALGLEAPTTIKGVSQSPIEGVSLAACFADGSAPSRRHTQYFEMIGHRSLYHEGWRAVCPWPGTSFVESGRRFGDPIDEALLRQLDEHGWELYHVAEDFAETNNLAARERERLNAMINQWYVEAGKYNVLPIDSRSNQRLLEERPQVAPDRQCHVYYQGTQVVPGSAAPQLLNRPHTIGIEVDHPGAGADGVLLSMGGNDGGFAIYVRDGVLIYGYNYVAALYFHVRASSPLPAGEHLLCVEVRPTGPAEVAAGKGAPAHVRLLVDGALVGEGDLPVTIPLSLSLTAGLAVGRHPGSPVLPDHKPPFAYPGRIRRALVDVSGAPIEDPQAWIRQALARQ